MSSNFPKTIYHYCSAQNFLSIIESKSVWLSLLSLSNDTLEGKLVSQTMQRLAKLDKLDSEALKGLTKAMSFLEEKFEGLGFCLSEDGDLLSQWRGYADDGNGISIGFSTEYLDSLSKHLRNNKLQGFNLERVEYSYENHEKRLRPIHEQIKKLVEAGAFRPILRGSLLIPRPDEDIKADEENLKQQNAQFYIQMLSLVTDFFKLKSPAFREEREWRLLTFFMSDIDTDCSYRSVNNRLIPYKKFDLVKLEYPTITEIILGPKHLTPPRIIGDFMKGLGFENVEIKYSEASYR